MSLITTTHQPRADLVEHTPEPIGTDRWGMTMTNAEVLEELQSRLDASKRIDPETDKVTARFHDDVLALNRHLKHVPQVVCADGLRMSVQASVFHYCSPRDSEGPWTMVEVGYPSERVEALMPYVDGDGSTHETVYGFVPLKIVAQVVLDHGGFAL